VFRVDLVIARSQLDYENEDEGTGPVHGRVTTKGRNLSTLGGRRLVQPRFDEGLQIRAVAGFLHLFNGNKL